MFPHHQMQILPYNRIVTDLNGMSPDAFLQRLSSAFNVNRAGGRGSGQPRRVRHVPRGPWYRLFIHAGLIPIQIRWRAWT